MANTEQLIALAERIAASLRGVSRNEWMRWMQVVEAYGGKVESAVNFAQHMSQDPTMRTNIRQAYRTIAQVVRQYQQRLMALQPEERQRVFGYVAWLRKIHENHDTMRAGRPSRTRASGGFPRG